MLEQTELTEKQLWDRMDAAIRAYAERDGSASTTGWVLAFEAMGLDADGQLAGRAEAHVSKQSTPILKAGLSVYLAGRIDELLHPDDDEDFA